VDVRRHLPDKLKLLPFAFFFQSKIFVYARDASMFEFGPAGHSS
jgi:hypothetical protein